jgi:ABC-type tungstate transport system substrate-binding protein
MICARGVGFCCYLVSLAEVLNARNLFLQHGPSVLLLIVCGAVLLRKISTECARVNFYCCVYIETEASMNTILFVLILFILALRFAPSLACLFFTGRAFSIANRLIQKLYEAAFVYVYAFCDLENVN